MLGYLLKLGHKAEWKKRVENVYLAHHLGPEKGFRSADALVVQHCLTFPPTLIFSFSCLFLYGFYDF